MDLTFTDQENAFRAEARAWLEANAPREPLASMDTADGFEAHRGQIEPHSTDQKYYAVSFPTSEEGRFDYIAGMAVTPVERIPDSLVVREIPAATSACGEKAFQAVSGVRSQSGGYVSSRKHLEC